MDEQEVVPKTITKLFQGVYPSFAMLAGMQLDLFSPLYNSLKTVEQLSTELGVSTVKLLPLLNSLVSAGLLVCQNDFYTNTEESNRYLVRDGVDYMGGAADFYSKIWRATLDTAQSIRTGIPQSKLDWSQQSREQLRDFFAKQYSSCFRAGKFLAKVKDFSKFNQLLDVGGGSGGICLSICEANPLLQGTLVDLPEVTFIAKDIISSLAAADRVNIIATDVVKEQPPGNYDVVVMRNFIQVLGKEQALAALLHIYNAMDSGGELLIIGRVLNDSKTQPLSSLGFGLVFLNFYDEGQTYTISTYKQWLTSVGFTDIEVDLDFFNEGGSLINCFKP